MLKGIYVAGIVVAILVFSSLSLLFAGCTSAKLGAEALAEEPDVGFFGVGEPLTERNIYENLSIIQAFERIQWLNVSCLREWVWRYMIFNHTGTGLNQSNVNVLNNVLDRAESTNVSIMGMVQDFPSWMTNLNESVNDSQIVPHRNLAEGSAYRIFLENYEQSWKTLAETFPNIALWEIGNEYNLHKFLHPVGYVETDNSTWFPFQENVDIVTDLLYYGSRGIHKGNPEATTVMCGLGPLNYGLSEIETFINITYQNIETGNWGSTNSNDFFEIACWHPYLDGVEPNQTNWIEPNNSIRNLMAAHGDADKPVVFSELGYTDNKTSEGAIAEYLTNSFALAQENFPWLKTIYWFRLVEINQSTTNNPKGFGLFNLDWTAKPAADSYKFVVPEFPSHILLLLFSGTTLAMAMKCQKRKELP